MKKFNFIKRGNTEVRNAVKNLDRVCKKNNADYIVMTERNGKARVAGRTHEGRILHEIHKVIINDTI